MSRCLLHKDKLFAFKQWLDARGVLNRPGRGEYQLLQVEDRGRWRAVYWRHDMKEHVTVEQPLEWLVRKFINETKGSKCQSESSAQASQA